MTIDCRKKNNLIRFVTIVGLCLATTNITTLSKSLEESSITVPISSNIAEQSILNHAMVCSPPTFQVQILPFGDAYTVGMYDADPREGIYGSQQGAYRGYLEQRLAKDGFNFDFVGSKKKKGFEGPKDIDHYGWYGLSLGRLASEGIINMAFFEEQYKRPHIVLFSAGVIDALSNNSESDMTQSLNTLVDGTMSQLNNPIMLMATMPPIKDPRTKIQQSRLAYNQATKNVVGQQAAKGRKIYLVDVAAVLTTSNSEDNFLPSESEYSTMASLFHQGICSALSSISSTPATPTATSLPTSIPSTAAPNTPSSTPIPTSTSTPIPTATPSQPLATPASTNTAYLYISLVANLLPGPDKCSTYDCFEPNDDFWQAKEIKLQQNVIGFTDDATGPRDIYRMQLEMGKSYVAKLEFDKSADLGLHVYHLPTHDDQDSRIAANTGQDNPKQLTFKAKYTLGKSDGWHYIEVYAHKIGDVPQYKLVVTEAPK